MKSKIARTALRTSLLCLTVITLSSCSSSYYLGENGIFGNPDADETVPKNQYDELQKKYQALLQEKSPAKPVITEEVPANQNQQIQIGTVSALDPSDAVSQIEEHHSKEENQPSLKPRIENAPQIEAYNVKTLTSSDDVDAQISKLRGVGNLIKENKFDQALSVLKELETSKERQIAVRAKMMLGDLLFNQNEYDLALQVYEEIINQYGFSGFVIKALGKLVVCCEKLNQPEKQAKYYSLLHDFFEAA